MAIDISHFTESVWFNSITDLEKLINHEFLMKIYSKGNQRINLMKYMMAQLFIGKHGQV